MNKKAIGYAFMAFLLIFTSEAFAQMEMRAQDVQEECAQENENVYDMIEKGPTICCEGLLLERCEGICTPSILGRCVREAKKCAKHGEKINLANNEKCCEGLVPQDICGGRTNCIVSERICGRYAFELEGPRIIKERETGRELVEKPTLGAPRMVRDQVELLPLSTPMPVREIDQTEPILFTKETNQVKIPTLSFPGATKEMDQIEREALLMPELPAFDTPQNGGRIADPTMPPIQEQNMRRGELEEPIPTLYMEPIMSGGDMPSPTMPPMQEPDMIRGTLDGGRVPIRDIQNTVKPKISEKEAKDYAEMSSVHAIELEVEEATEDPFYLVSGTKKGKLLFFFDVETPIKLKVNAETGEKTTVKKPWYWFLIR